MTLLNSEGTMGLRRPAAPPPGRAGSGGSAADRGPSGEGPALRAGRAVPGWATLAVCCLAQFMVVLDISIVNVALPQMKIDLHLSQGGQQWVINAYTLTFAGLLMLGGRAADLFGRRRVFLLGLAAFTVFSLLGGLAQSGAWLITARALQGASGAVLAPATLSLLTTTFTAPAARRRALGAWSATAASGAAIGVLAGGILTDLLDWRWVLFVNVPVGIAVLAGAAWTLPESRAGEAARQLDIPGAVTVTAGMALIVYGIVGTATHPWGSAHTISILALGIALLGAFALIEARLARHPLVPLAVFRRRSLTVANGVSFAIGASIFSLFFFLSLYLQQVNGYTPLRAGLAFLPVGLAILTTALLAARIVARIGARWQLTAGLLLTATGLAWLTQLTPGDGYWPGVFVPGVLAGAGFGLSFVPMTMAATGGVPPQQAGLASGLVSTTRQVGGAIGLAVTATVAAAVHSQSAAPHAVASAVTTGYDRAFGVGAVVLGAGALVALLLPRHLGVAQRSAAADSSAPAGPSTEPEVDSAKS